jgi:hypothetical protein
MGGTWGAFNREIVLARGVLRVLVSQPSDDPSKPGELVVHDVTTGTVIHHFRSVQPGVAPDPNSHISLIGT